MYFALRPTRRMVLPCSWAGSPGSTGVRKRGSKTATRRMLRPSRWGCSPRQIVSTSGSSGIKKLSAVSYQPSA